MKILFVSSGNNDNFEVAPFIKAQGESLRKKGIEVEYFLINERGMIGYFKNISLLKQKFKKNNYDLIHAHYSLTAWVAVLSRLNIPIIVSLMGSDTYGDYNKNGKLILSSYIQIILTQLLQPFVKSIIAKSKNIEKYVYLKNKVNIIPNGINFDIFKPIDQMQARHKIGLKPGKKYVLFLGDKYNKRKNHQLVIDAIEHCKEKFNLINPYPVNHDQVPLYLNASDCLIMTSYNEGSPNIIKEAMACNLPIVSTRVGDVEWLLDDLEGCYLADFDPNDFAEKIKLALKYSEEKGKTKGRDRFLKLGLDSESVANKIINVYKEVLKRK